MKEVSTISFEAEVLKSAKPVVVDFWATWCGPCRTLLPIIEEISNNISSVDITKLDASANLEIAKQYNVNQIPCLIVFKDGKEVARKVNPTPNKQELITWINENI